MPAWLNLPNLLTLLRLLLVAPVIAASMGGRHGEALALFLLAAITDGADGFLARRLNAVTRLGAYFDPMADKCLLSGVYLALALAGTAPWWFVALVLGRDVYILLGVGVLYAATGERRFPPSIWGKISTVMQIAAAVLLMGHRAFPQFVAPAAGQWAVWPATAATLWSGFDYTRRAVRHARRGRIDAAGAAE